MLVWPLIAAVVLLDILTDLQAEAGRRTAEAVLLSHAHPHQLAAASHQECQLLRSRIRQRPDFGPDWLSKVGQDLCVDAVSLCQLAGGFGEVTHLSGVDCDDRQVGRSQGSNHRHVDSSSGLEHDERKFELSDSFN
jgi:hypothetical protein